MKRLAMIMRASILNNYCGFYIILIRFPCAIDIIWNSTTAISHHGTNLIDWNNNQIENKTWLKALNQIDQNV